MEKETNSPIGAVIRAARVERKLTQEQLSETSGVSQQTIAKIENGKIRFSKQLPKLFAALGISRAEFAADVDRYLVQQVMAQDAGDARRTHPEQRQIDQKIMVLGLEMRPEGQFLDNWNEIGSFDKIQQLIEGPKVLAMYAAETLMSPAIEPGDVVVLNARLPALPGTDCAFIEHDDDSHPWRVAFRRLVSVSDDAWTVEQFNPRRTYELLRSEYQSARRIVAIYRRP